MKKLEKRFARELAFIKEQLEHRVQARRSMHELQEKMLTEISALIEGPDEKKPIPKKIREEIKNHQRRLTIRKSYKSVGSGYACNYRKSLFQREFLDRYYGWEDLIHQRGLASTDQTTQQYIDPVKFINPVSEGATSTNEGNHFGIIEYKTGYSRVGYAYLEGPEAQAWNRTVFGFVSTFALPGPGKENTVKIFSNINMNFIWPDGYLEALSFGKKAWGEVTANAQLDVLVADSAYRDGVDTLLYGVSPRGNWEEGEIGVYQPWDERASASHFVEFNITNPINGTYEVSVFELAEFIAERHHRIDRCDAVIWGTCTWDPLDVQIITHG